MLMNCPAKQYAILRSPNSRFFSLLVAYFDLVARMSSDRVFAVFVLRECEVFISSKEPVVYLRSVEFLLVIPLIIFR